MKNLVSLVSLLSLLLVSGCSQEEVLKNDSTSVSGEGRIFTSSFENNDSRTYVEEGLYSRWTEGDRVSLFDGCTTNRQYKFDGKTGDNGGTFSMVDGTYGTGNELMTNYAVYPYDKDITISDNGVITVVLPAEQSYAENSYGLGDNMMVAVTHNVYDTFLNFKSVGGGLKLQLYGNDVNVKSITLTGNNGEKIAGKAHITAAYDKAPVVTMSDDADTSVTLACGESGVKVGSTVGSATPFWIVLPPIVFEKGITVTVTDMKGKVFSQSTSQKLVIERNVIKPMSAFLLKAPLPDLSGEWILSTSGDTEFRGTLVLIRNDGNSASYKVVNHDSFGTWGVGIDDETVRITHSGINWIENWINGTFVDNSTIVGTKFVSSAGAVFDCNWTLSRTY